MKLTRRQRHITHQTLIYAAAALVSVICVFPFYNAILTSLRTGQELFLTNYLPTSFHWENYVNALMVNGIARSLLNSFIVASVTVGICLLVSITAAFALARIKFKGRKYILFTILCVSMFPQVAVLSGMFELVRFLGLYDSLGAQMSGISGLANADNHRITLFTDLPDMQILHGDLVLGEQGAHPSARIARGLSIHQNR
jgi:trehalose/maltose transport system permease protein